MLRKSLDIGSSAAPLHFYNQWPSRKKNTSDETPAQPELQVPRVEMEGEWRGDIPNSLGPTQGEGISRLGWWWWWIFLILLKRIRRIHQILILRIGILRIRICEVWMTDYLPSPIKFV